MARWTAAAVCLCIAAAAWGEDWSPVEGQLLTRWAKDVRPDKVWPEYPRPQMVRRDWRNLNGLWEYAITDAAAKDTPPAFDGRILVPFCVESALSGVKKPVSPEQALWYRRTFETSGLWRHKRVLLHFGAVDWASQVWVNGKLVGEHRGGYDPLTFDVTDALTPDGPQTLVVRVTDPTDTSWQPRGKQVLEPKGIWYTAVTGIWQTVWLEPVPQAYIRGLKITPKFDQSEVMVEADVVGDGHVRVEVIEKGDAIALNGAAAGEAITLKVPDAKAWTPDSPNLYDLRVVLMDGDEEVDAVRSYFGMRKISLGQADGFTRILLNNQPLFQFGTLDQGWWPDGLYTPPTDEALRYDLEVLKRLGMNMLREHVKVAPARFYYYCDQLGLLVWQDMPSGDKYIGGDDPDITRTPESGENFERELGAMVDGLRNHPSIVTWVLYNEGWGQWDTARMTDWLRKRDPTRLVNSTTGWADRGAGDMMDVHVYPGPGMRPPEEKRASVLGEFGGLGWPVEGHLWWDKKNWGYRTYHSRDELQAAYENVIGQLRLLLGQGLSAAVYTQTSDVEGEVNGLMTYDRAVLKLNADAVAELHRKLYLPAPIIREIVPSSEVTPQQWRYTTDEPAGEWAAADFDDSSWKTGEGMFGTEGTPGVRVGTEWNTPDIWMRRTFHVDTKPDAEPWLNVYHDEDAEVYINGVLAGSFNRWVTSHVLSPMSAEARAALHVGENVIAVHCHQTDGGQGVDVGISAVMERADR